MLKKNPSCAEYIVAAIRGRHLGRKYLNSVASSGGTLRSIFALATRFHSEEEFRRSLAALLDEGVVLMVASVKDTVLGEESSIRLQKIHTVPPCAPLLNTWWFLNAEGEQINTRTAKIFTKFFRPCLYVVEDGLPARIAEFVTSTGMTKAEEIMASLQE